MLRITELVAGLDIASQVYNRFLIINNIEVSFILLYSYEAVHTNLEFKRFLAEMTNEKNRK